MSNDLTFANPENISQTATLAYDMYEHIARAGLAGLPFEDVAAAIGILNGMFLAGAYTNVSSQEIAIRTLGRSALDYARRLKDAPRIPYDSLNAAGVQQ